MTRSAETPLTQAAPAPSARAALLLLAIVTLFRLVYAAFLGMTQDETHYWQWSRYLSYSYYDQGPGIAYLIRLGTLLLGDTPLGIRVVPLLLGAATAWLSYLVAARWLGPRPAWWTLLLGMVAPLFAVGGVIATYDGPQVFFWTAALLALTWTVQNERAAGWYLVGALVGLGSLCKLTMLLFAPGVLLFLLLVPRYRRWLATPHPYLAFALALALFSPVVLWNLHHDWIGFKHAQALSSRSRGAAPGRWLGEFLAGQLLFTGPLLWLTILGLFFRLFAACRQSGAENTVPVREWGMTPEAARFIFSFFAPTLLICLYVSLKSKLEVNWPAPMYVTALMGAGAWFASLWERRRFGWPAASVAFSLLLIVVAFFPGLPHVFGIQISAQTGQKLNETYGWAQIMSPIEAARRQLEAEGKPYFIAGVNYRVNSVLAFHLSSKPEVQGLYLNARRDQYYVWTDPKELVGQNALLCFDGKNEEAVVLARQYFTDVTLVASPVVYRPGYTGAVKQWYIYACHNFKGYDPDKHATGF